MRKGCPIVISAPSGSGKSTLCQLLLAEFPNLRFSISCTTRKKRINEVQGKDYIFIDKDDFLARRNSGKFAEWAQVHGNFYGTPMEPLKELLKSGHDVLLDVDVQGAAQIRGSLPQAFFIFILPPSMTELETRLRKRNSDSEESIRQRMLNARLELYQANWYDALVINDDLNKAYSDLRSAYITATLAPERLQDCLNSLFFDLHGDGQWQS